MAVPCTLAAIGPSAIGTITNPATLARLGRGGTQIEVCVPLLRVQARQTALIRAVFAWMGAPKLVAKL